MSHRVEPTPFAGQEGSEPGDETFLELPGGQGVRRMVFCWCPRPVKPFRMGSPETEDGRSDNETAHWATLTRGFWMAKHPLNQGQYRAFETKHESRFGKGDEWPVDRVSWEEARRFCEAATARLGIPGGWRLALPTEAQWEYACRAGGDFEEPFGIGDGRNLHAQWANFDGTYPYGEAFQWKYRESTAREGSFPPNAWGLHDLHGQVWEWMEDWYGEYSKSTEERSAVDPVGASRGASRVLRGGCWGDGGGLCRAASRHEDFPGYRCEGIGFRPVLVPPGAVQGPEGPRSAERPHRRAGARDERPASR